MASEISCQPSRYVQLSTDTPPSHFLNIFFWNPWKMAQKWPKNGLHHPMISSSHHPIITTSPHPIIASSHLGTPHMLWKWLTNTTSQKISLGGQTISLRFLTPQRGSINMRFAAFFKSYQIIKLKFWKFGKIFQILRHLQMFCWILIADFCKSIFC